MGAAPGRLQVGLQSACDSFDHASALPLSGGLEIETHSSQPHRAACYDHARSASLRKRTIRRCLYQRSPKSLPGLALDSWRPRVSDSCNYGQHFRNNRPTNNGRSPSAAAGMLLKMARGAECPGERASWP